MSHVGLSCMHIRDRLFEEAVDHRMCPRSIAVGQAIGEVVLALEGPERHRLKIQGAILEVELALPFSENRGTLSGSNALEAVHEACGVNIDLRLMESSNGLQVKQC